MRGGLRRLLTASIVAAVVFAGPTAALAGSGSACSACKVYVEQQQSAGGSQPTNQSGGPTETTQKPAPVSKKATHQLEHAKHKKVLSSLVRNPAFGPKRGLQSTGVSVAEPSPLGAAVDLGSGPAALLAALAGSVLLLLALGGFRGWRRWRGRPASPPG
jgi:hypothetical protein